MARRNTLTTHLVGAHQNPVDQSDCHHLLQVLHGRVLVNLLHHKLGDKFGNVPLKREEIIYWDKLKATDPPTLDPTWHSLHATQMHDPQHDGGLHTEQDEEVHCLSQEPLQGGGDGVLPS